MHIQPVSSVTTQPVGCQPLKPVEETKPEPIKDDSFEKKQEPVKESSANKSRVSFKQTFNNFVNKVLNEQNKPVEEAKPFNKVV